MSFVNAKSNGWDTSSLNFHVVNTLDGAIEALKLGKADYFMWEHFTTKPIVDSGIFRRLADCPTPWPCFVIAARNETIENMPNILKSLLEIINNYTKKFKQMEGIEYLISERYNIQIDDVRSWLEITEWSQSSMDQDTIFNVQKHLLQVKMIPNITEYQTLNSKIS